MSQGSIANGLLAAMEPPALPADTSAPEAATPEQVVAEEAALETAPEPVAVTGEPAPVAEGEEQQLQPAEEAEEDPTAPITPDGESSGGKMLMFRKSKAVRMLQADEAWQKVQNEIPGATPEEILSYKQSHSLLDKISLDMMSGDPGQVSGMLNYFSRTSPQGVFAMAQVMTSPDFARIHPEAAELIGGQMATQVRERTPNIVIGELNRIAASLPANWAPVFTRVAAEYGKMVNVSPAGADYPASALPAPANGADPTSQENARLRAELANREQSARAAVYGGFVAQAQSETVTEVDSLIDQAVSRHINKEKEPLLYEGAFGRLQRAIREAMGSNPTFNNDERSMFERARLSSANDREVLRGNIVRHNKQFAQRVIALRSKQVMQQAGRTVVEENGAHLQAQRARAANGREPVGGGSPTPQSVTGQKIDPKKMTYEQAMNAVREGIMSS